MLDIAGGRLAEPLLAVLYAGSIVAWSVAGLVFGRRVAILTAAVLLLYPGYAGMFHVLSSELMFRSRIRWFAADANSRERQAVGHR